jgi:hypothetical protein
MLNDAVLFVYLSKVLRQLNPILREEGIGGFSLKVSVKGIDNVSLVWYFEIKSGC